MSRTATQRVWLVGEGDQRERAETTLRTVRRLDVRPTPAGEALAAAVPGDRVLLSGLDPGPTVRLAEALSGTGAAVLLDASPWPALARALGRRIWGLRCIELPPTHAWPALAMRVRDIVLAGAGLLTLVPAFLVLALLVKRSSAGPVFFATAVVGRHGKLFTWRKFRTMTMPKDQTDEPAERERLRAFIRGEVQPTPRDELGYKIIDDSRVTRIGRVLRRHSVDELPQLWNVLRGEMTLVGPRPCLPHEYEMQEPWQRLRFRVTPGLTGPWQAYGRSRVRFDEMALMDYCYARVKSPWVDVQLVARTMAVVLTGAGGR